MDVTIEHRLTEVEDRAKSNQRRIEEMEKRQDNLDELVGTVKVLAVREQAVENDVKEIKSDVKMLTSKPGKRWEKAMETILTVVLGAVVGFILAQIGL